MEEYGTPLDLFESVKQFIAQYVEVGDAGFLDVGATYVLLTWVYDKFNALPYLRALGDFNTGKTRLIETVGVYRPDFVDTQLRVTASVAGARGG